jgi:hypothetical protein
MKDADKNCKGCEFLMIIPIECLLTRIGIESIPDCPCQTCLIKIVCKDPCDDLIKAYKNIGEDQCNDRYTLTRIHILLKTGSGAVIGKLRTMVDTF